jgi:hypothetical protein
MIQIMINGSNPSWPTSNTRMRPLLCLKSAVLKQGMLSLQSISRGADTDFDSHILPARAGFSRAKSRTKVQDDCIGEVDLQPSHSAVTSELVNVPV